MNIRKLIFWSHLVVGVVAGIVILTMAVTGVLIAYKPQIVGAAERRIANVAASGANAQPLAPQELLQRVTTAVPGGRATAFTMRRDAADPVLVNFGREKTMLAHPVTGAVLGEGSKWRSFLHEVEHFHRDLALGQNGKLITGAASIAFGVLLISGLILWIPRKWSRQALSTALVPSLKLRGKARHWNWHNALGFWAALPLMVAITTGMIISYRWANDLLFRLTGNEPPPPRTAPARPAGDRAAKIAEQLRLDHVNAMHAAAVERVPAWQTLTFRFGENAGAPVTVMADAGNGGRPDLRAQLSFDAKSGELQKFEPYGSYNLGRQLRMWVKPLHTGEAWGLLGQTIGALAALAAAFLVWTGFALALRRFRQRRRGTPVSGTAISPQPAPELAQTID